MDELSVSRQRWHDHRLFLSHFRKSPRTVGAIAPSSQRLARTMLDGLAWGPDTRVVELGPGTGAVTGEIVGGCPRAQPASQSTSTRSSLPGSRSAGHGSTRCARRPRTLWRSRERTRCCRWITSCPGCRSRACHLQHAADRRCDRRDASSRGYFTTFQYVHAYGFPSALAVRRMLTRKMGLQPTRTLVVGNVPPALVFRWRKSSGRHGAP